MGLFLGKVKLLWLAFALSAATVAFGQTDTGTSVYLGGSLGLSRYTFVQNEIAVSPYYRTNTEVGLTSLIYFNNKLFTKTGLFYTYYRSPFVNNSSTYDEFIQIPILIPFLTLNHLNLLIGPQLSVITRQGLANYGDDNYQMINSSFGGLYKFGIVFETNLIRSNDKFLNSIGVKFQIDISALTIKTNNNLSINDDFISGGVFFNLNKKASR